MNVIEIGNPVKYYGKHRGTDKVNLSVKEGDFFGFTGPNGVGKSITVHTLPFALLPLLYAL